MINQDAYEKDQPNIDLRGEVLPFYSYMVYTYMVCFKALYSLTTQNIKKLISLIQSLIVVFLEQTN